MACSLGIVLALQSVSFHGLACPVGRPDFDASEAQVQITAAPVLGAVQEHRLLRQEDDCT